MRLRERPFRAGRRGRMGILASDLKRLRSWVRMRRSDQEIGDRLREIAWVTEMGWVRLRSSWTRNGKTAGCVACGPSTPQGEF